MHAHLIRDSTRHQNLPDFLPFLSPNPPTYLFRPQILSALLPQWADFRLLPILSLLAQPWELSRPMPHSAVDTVAAFHWSRLPLRLLPSGWQNESWV